MQKILYIVTQSEWGGAQRYIFDLATNIQKGQEYTAHVAAGGNGQLFTLLEQKNIAVTRLKYLTRPISPMADIRAYFELKRLLAHINPDIVHLNSSKAGFLGSLAGSRVGAKKIIYTAHGFVFNEPLPGFQKRLYKEIELASSKRMHKIIAVSEFDRETGIKAGMKQEKLVTIHNGIDANIQFLGQETARSFLATKIPNYQTAKTPLVGCVANFYATKGLDVLIKAMAKIDATLIIIGNGSLRSKFEKLIKQLNLKNKVFMPGGTETFSEAAPYLKAFDLFVLPSRKEGLPYTLLEAMAARVPVVATAVGGVPEIITDRQNGYLVNPDNADDLADKIKLGLQNPLPTSLGPDFTLAEMLTKTIQTYRE